jgi:hypothetical protein
MTHGRFGATLARAAVVPGVFAAVATVAGVMAALALSGQRSLVLHVWLVALGGLGLWAGTALIRVALPASPSAMQRALPRRPVPPAAPAELERIQRTVSFAASSSFDFHVRLRPLLRDIAAQRLLTRHGIDMDRDAGAARRVLGAAVWDALNGEAPVNRLEPGPSVRELHHLADTLEAL